MELNQFGDALQGGIKKNEVGLPSKDGTSRLQPSLHLRLACLGHHKSPS